MKAGKNLGGGLGLAVLSLVMNTSTGNYITQLPVVILMMFAVAGVAGLLYFGGRNLSDPAIDGARDSDDIGMPNQEAA